MSLTISSAIRENKLYAGKQVEILGQDPRLNTFGRVVDLKSDKMVLELFAPALYPQQLLYQEKEVTVRFVVPEDATYSFSGAVVSYNEPVHLLLLEQFSELKRIEQRSSYRLKTARTLYICSNNQGAEKWSESILMDISRGGARLLTSEPLNTGDRVKLLLNLDEVDHSLEASAEVVHVSGKDGQFDAGVRFTGLSLSDEDHLIEFILQVWSEAKKR